MSQYFEKLNIGSENGVALIYQQDNYDPLITFGAMFKGSILFEDSSNNGVSTVIRELVTDYSDQGLLGRGIPEIHSFANKDSLGFMFKTMSGLFDSSLELFTEVIKHLKFSRSRFEAVKSRVLTKVERESHRLEHQVEKAYRNAFFKDHPYRLLKSGSPETIAPLTRDVVYSAHRKFINADNMSLFLSGSINVGRLRAILELTFNDFKGHPLTAGEFAGKRNSRQVFYMRRGSEKLGFLVIAYPSVMLAHRDRIIFELIKSLLLSRLQIELREKRDLAYFCQVSLDTGILPGSLFISLAARPAKIEYGRDLVLREVQNLRSGLIHRNELSNAISSVKNRMYTRLITGSTASLLLEIAYRELYEVNSIDFFDQAIDKLNTATVEDITRVASLCLDDNLSTTLIESPQTAANSLTVGAIN